MSNEKAVSIPTNILGLIVSSSTIDKMFKITLFTKIGTKFTFFTNIGMKFSEKMLILYLFS